MVTNEQIARINELAKKSKSVGLTAEEVTEQKKLRRLYIDSFKTNLSATLDNIVIQNPDGSQVELKKRKKH